MTIILDVKLLFVTALLNNQLFIWYCSTKPLRLFIVPWAVSCFVMLVKWKDTVPVAEQMRVKCVDSVRTEWIKKKLKTRILLSQLMLPQLMFLSWSQKARGLDTEVFPKTFYRFIWDSRTSRVEDGGREDQTAHWHTFQWTITDITKVCTIYFCICLLFSFWI